MTTKMADLPIHLKQSEIFFIGQFHPDDPPFIRPVIRPVLVVGKLNSTGHDLALFFSSLEKAVAYRDRFPGLNALAIFQATIGEMIEIFAGGVEYFVIDPED